jgi:hypothetical protein
VHNLRSSITAYQLLAKINALKFNGKLFGPLGGLAHRKLHHHSIFFTFCRLYVDSFRRTPSVKKLFNISFGWRIPFGGEIWGFGGTKLGETASPKGDYLTPNRVVGTIKRKNRPSRSAPLEEIRKKNRIHKEFSTLPIRPLATHLYVFWYLDPIGRETTDA